MTDQGTGRAEVAGGIARYRDYLPIALALVLLFAALLGYRGDQRDRLGPPLGDASSRDFRAILQAVDDIQAGEPIYEDALSFGESPTFEAAFTWNVVPYIYPPSLAVLASPLGGLDIPSAVNLWVVFNLMLIVAAAWVAVRAFSEANTLLGQTTRFIFVLILFFLPATTQHILDIGEVDIVILFTLLLTYLFYRRGYSLAAGVTLAVAIMFRPHILLMVAYFIWKRQWRLVGVTLVTTLILILPALLALGSGVLGDYLAVGRSWSTSFFLVWPTNQTILGLAHRLFTTNFYTQPLVVMPWLATALPVVAGVLAMVIWALLVSREDDRARPINGLSYGLTVTTLMFVSTASQDIHSAWLLVPLVAMLLCLIDNTRSLRDLVLIGLVLLIGIYLGYPALKNRVFSGAIEYMQSGQLLGTVQTLFTGGYLYGFIALEVLLALFVWRRRSARQAD